MNILVINCGSSSLKFQLIDSETEKCIAKGLCERIGIEGSQITYTPDGGEKEADCNSRCRIIPKLSIWYWKL